MGKVHASKRPNALELQTEIAQFTQTEVEVYLKKDDLILQTRLVIEKVPAQVKAQRLRKINQSSRKKGYKPRKRVKILAGFNLYITNAPATSIPREHIR